MLTRTKKQFAYGVLYLAAITGTVSLIGFVAADPQAAPTPAPQSPYTPIEIGDITVISHSRQPSSPTRSVDIVASLRNPNLRAGISDYPLTFTLFDTDGQELAQVQESTYLLPGARQFAAALNVTFPSGRRIGRAEVTPPQNPQFISLPESIELPRFSLFLRDRVNTTIAGQPLQEQTGIVTNTSTLDWERVEVVAIARDSGGNAVAVGTTFVGRLAVGEQREFTLQWPQPQAEVAQVVALPSTNMFREGNIVEIIGDPGTLR